MNKAISIAVPPQLSHPFFFKENAEIFIEVNELTIMKDFKPFIYEAAFFSDIQAVKPWEHQEQCIPILCAEWCSVKELLQSLYMKREIKHVLPLMKKAISLLLAFIYWGNNIPVVLSKCLNCNDLSIKPVNMSERLDFIMQRPTLYHSFIQLGELMNEMNKQYVKHQALKKASKH